MDYYINSFLESFYEFADMVENRFIKSFSLESHPIMNDIWWFFDIELPVIGQNLYMFVDWYFEELRDMMKSFTDNIDSVVRNIADKIDEFFKKHFSKLEFINNLTGQTYGWDDVSNWFQGVKA